MLNVIKKMILPAALSSVFMLSSMSAYAANNLNFTPKLTIPVNEHSNKTIPEREAVRDITLAYYYYEEGSHRNLKKAKFWVDQGIKKKDKDSYFLLGMMYLKGDAIKKDPVMAIDNLKEAAELDHKQANEMLGLIYYYGVDVPIDLDETFMYLSEIADVASPESKTILGKLYYSGDGTAKDLNMAFKYINEAAIAKHPEAQAMLSVLYKKGQGTAVNLDESYKWLFLAVDKSLEARLLMGMKFESGEGVPVDLQEAYFYYSWAKDGAFPDKSNIPLDNRYDKMMRSLKPKMTKEQIDKAELMLRAKISVKNS